MTASLAGIAFLAIGHHDLKMFRAPGVYALCRREAGARVVLQVGHSDEIARVHGSPAWTCALAQGLNEVLINLDAVERIDRMQISARVTRATALAPPQPGAFSGEALCGAPTSLARTGRRA